MSFEEDDEFELRPLPDPNSRTWRHPSEIAAEARAMQAAVEAELTATNRRNAVPAQVLVAAGVLVGFMFLGVITNRRPPQNINQTEVALQIPEFKASLSRDIPVAKPNTDLRPISATSTVPGNTHISVTGRPEGVLSIHAGPQDQVVATGLIADGLILTSASALGSETNLKVSSWADDFKLIEVIVIGRDMFSDLAVLAPVNNPDVSLLTTKNLTPAALSHAVVNEKVVLISGGASSEADASLGKLLTFGDRARSVTGHEMVGLASTSVELTAGDAGAGIFDSSGYLRGVVVNTNSHLASALPVETALEIAHSVRATGKPSPVWMGIAGQTVTTGVQVLSVAEESPAFVSGLEPGDVITTIDGNTVLSMADLVHYIRTQANGAAISLSVIRQDTELALTVSLSWHNLSNNSRETYLVSTGG